MRKGAIPADFRFDAEFFKKRFLYEDSALSKCDLHSIGSFAFVTDGPHGYHEVDEDSSISMLTAKNASDWFSDSEKSDKVAQWVHDKNIRSALQVDDVILSTRGTVGNCALVIEESLPSIIDQDVARIALNNGSGFDSVYVVAYLNCAFGQDHIKRNASGMVQQGLSLAKVRSIPVPLMTGKTQTCVRSLVESALSTRRQASRLQQTAELELLHLLGLAGWKPPEPLSYVASSADAFAAGRLDAQYFRPKFDEMHNRLKSIGGDLSLADALLLNARGRQPQYDEIGLPVINSKHVRTNRVVLGADNRFGIEEGSPIFIQKGDVLLNGTGVGTIGRAAPYIHAAKALPDNHVTVLRPKTIDPIYLSVFLNSQLGQMQIERFISGSSGQIELYPSDIAKIVVWDAPEKVQLDIRGAILSAFDQERRAQDLLDRAKRAVEIAIEESEAAALQYLEEAGA